MKRYDVYAFQALNEDQVEILSGLLSNIDNAGVEETDVGLTVYLQEAEVNLRLMDEVARMVKANYLRSTLDDQNWNSLWESSFEPVVVDDFVTVRADFHPPTRGKELEIVITPKMSFGTGHHATTWSMLSEMRNIPFNGARVLDFGTGTGILAILAEKLGALSVKAIDNDDWSIENAKENIMRNNSTRIALMKADDASGNEEFDVILANINKNVIAENMKWLRSQITAGGTVLLSGLLVDDEPEIREKAKEEAFQVTNKTERSNWLCLKLSPI